MRIKFHNITIFFWAVIACFGCAWAQPAIVVTGPQVPALMLGGAAWADYDGDNLIDLLVYGKDSLGISQTTLLHNNGSGFDPDTSQQLTGLSMGDAAWTDMDADGDLDLLMTGEISPRHSLTAVYRNNAGTLTPTSQPGIPNLSLGHCRWADFDNDGDRDFILTGFNEVFGFQGVIGKNDGQGNFAPVSNPLYSTRDWTSLAVGDFDGDGLPDIAFSDISPRLSEGMRTRILKNVGALNFSVVSSAVPGLYEGSLAFGDQDGDGKKDLLVTGSGVTTHAAVYRCQGGQFMATSASFRGIGHGDAVWADFDQDGDLDVVLSGKSDAGLSTLFFQNSGGSLALAQGPTLMPALYHSRLAVADWNADGYPDFVVVGQDAADKPQAYLAMWNNSLQTFKF